MKTVPPELWIGPTLDGRFNYREPTQIGRIKKLGIQKPWAPPRSYGLVARLNGDGEAIESLHSRVDGRIHGVTAVRAVGRPGAGGVKGKQLPGRIAAGRERRERGLMTMQPQNDGKAPLLQSRRCFRSSRAARSMADCTPSTAWISNCAPAKSTPCSAKTAPGNRHCARRSPARSR